MPVLGQTILLAADQYGRSAEARKWHASKKEDMVVSDTTLPRVLRGVDREPAMGIPYAVVE